MGFESSKKKISNPGFAKSAPLAGLFSFFFSGPFQVYSRGRVLTLLIGNVFLPYPFSRLLPPSKSLRQGLLGLKMD